MIISTFQEESSRISAPEFIPPRMETIKRTAEIFNLPVHFVRTKVNNGEVVAVRAGKRFLVNVDRFADYLNSSTIKPLTISDDSMSGAVRINPISVKEVG